MKQKRSESPETFPRHWAEPRGPASSRSDPSTGAVEPSIRAPVSAANLETVRSEPTVHRLIEGLDIAIVVLDSGIIVEANNLVPALFGRSVGAMLGLHVKELVANESLVRLAHFLEFDAPEPILVLGLCQDQRSVSLRLRAVASIMADRHRLRVTSLSRWAAVEKAVEETTTPTA